MAENIKIKISSEADLAGFERANEKFKELDKSAGNFLDTLKLGVGIDIGGKVVAQIGRLPEIFSEAVQRGVAFNVELSDAELAMAKIIGRFQGLNAEAAKGAAARAMAQIVELEPATAGSLGSLVQGFNNVAGAALSSGLDVKSTIDLVAKFSNALSNVGIPAEQLGQELRSIFSGNITADSGLAKVLEISNSDVSAAKEAGNLVGFLTEKIGDLGDAGDSYAAKSSSMQSALDKLLATATQPIFVELKKGLGDVADILNGPLSARAKEFAEVLRVIRDAAAETGAKLDLAFHARTVATLASYTTTGGLLARVLNRVIGDPVRKRIADREAASAPGPEEAPGVKMEEAHQLTAAEASAAERAAQALARAEEAFGSAAEAAALAGKTDLQVLEALGDKLATLRNDFTIGRMPEGKFLGNDFNPADVLQNVRTDSSLSGDQKVSQVQQLTEILKLEKQIADAKEKVEKKNAEAAKKEAERARDQEAKLRDLNTEFQIAQALVTGNTDLAAELERQRDLAREIATIDRDDLTPEAKAQAIAAATITSELRAQKVLKDQEAQRATYEAEEGVSAAEQGKSRRAVRDAKLNKFKVGKRQELEKLGYSPEEIEKKVEDAAFGFERKLKRDQGIVGGPARKALQDEGGSALDAFNQSKNDNIALPGHLLPPRTPGLDFFHRKNPTIDGSIPTSVGDVLPPLDGSKLPAPTEGASGAANAVEAAGKAAEGASKQLEGAAKTLESAQGNFASAAAAISTASTQIQSSLQTIASQMSAIETRLSTLESTSTSTG